jgi:polyphosphate kinase
MDPSRYLNRELSLLDFQERVLALASHPRVPLLERVKFVAIVSQNLDEFFQVRVAGLQEQARSHVAGPGPDGMTPSEQLRAIRERVEALIETRDTVFLKEILPALEAEGIRIVGWDSLQSEERAVLDDVFERQIFPVLTPLAVDPSHPFPYVSNLSLNLAVLVKDPSSGRMQFARVKVPQILPRFVNLPGSGNFIALEQLIAAHLDRLFPGMEIAGHYTFRVTRNADLAVEEEEAEDLLEAMETVLRFRQHSARAVRLQAHMSISDEILDLLQRELELQPIDVYVSRAPLALGGLFALLEFERPDLKYPPWTPTTQPALVDRADSPVDYFTLLKQGDLLVHVPYESFTTSTGAFLAQAADDPNVLAIKQTLYRTSAPEDPALGGEASIVRSLIRAAQAGKQVVVLVELKARFDEEANINWAKMLEAAGVHVVYGVSGLKTHSKTVLVVRKEHDGLRRYSNVGTGNYNPKTARLYEDLHMFTADPEIGADLSELFNSLTGFSQADTYRRLIVAPTMLRPRMLQRIREEAAKGSDGYIFLKCNHLVDPEVIDALYEASAAGCRVDLVVRGMCSIRPGVPGLSEHIRVRSIVGEFLEHSRIYRFGNPGGQAIYYMGSADMMPRNLNNRVEVLVPVTDVRLKARLEQILQAAVEDTEMAWELGADGTWHRVAGPVRPTEPPVTSEEALSGRMRQPDIGVPNLQERMKALAIERSRS